MRVITQLRFISQLVVILVFLTGSACSVNPVTGEKQFLLGSNAEDISIGKSQYGPAQQAQGGQYTLDPALSTYISQVGQKLARVSDQPKLPYEFVVLNNSVPNAWALPSGKIAINRGLLTQLKNESQLAAVLSHEIVHAAARHGAQRIRDNRVIQAGMAGLNLGIKGNDYRSLVIGGASLGANLTTAKYGRDHELESDLYGMRYMARAGYDLQGAIELQKLFVTLSKSSSNKNNWFKGLFASHPPSQERVRENIKTARTLNTQDGFIGEKEFQQALAYLQVKQPAYQLANQASKALHQKNLTQALSLINQAIEIETKEAQFRSLKGEIFQQQGKADLALKEHDIAVKLNPEQFSGYLNRAKTHQSIGQKKAAKEDYLKSMKLLPTSLAAMALGNLFQQSGNKAKAITYYSQAATSAGKTGRQASINMARLEINDKPEKYLRVTHHQDANGPLLIFFENKSALKIKRLTLDSFLYNAKGALLKRERWHTRGPIKAGSRSRYYPLPVSYHLQHEHSITTRIIQVEL